MTNVRQVLFIDDEPHIRMAASQTLNLADMEVACFDGADDALQQLSPHFPGVLVCDVKMPSLDGIGFMARAFAIDPDLPVILVTGHGDIAMAVNAMRDGAYDFLEKPYSPEVLVEVVNRALEKRSLVLENRNLRLKLKTQGGLGSRIMGDATVMQELRNTVAQVADTDADVLILGETGTGKELVARSLHDQSSRRNGHFVAINCGALPEQLIESELFGHEAGAFTGARTRRVGKFEYASGGTLFLDEIESMPLTLQIRLLRVLQERMLERLGSNKSVELDLRVVAATKVDLRKAADRGEFREDLYYRLNVVRVDIPPLRERRDDIHLLFQHFTLIAATRYKRQVSALSPQQIPDLMAHEWPGNVRELQNAAERYVLLGGGREIGTLAQTGNEARTRSLRELVDEFERCLIESELKACNGNVSKATDALVIPRKTLVDKIRRYGLDRHDFRSEPYPK